MPQLIPIIIIVMLFLLCLLCTVDTTSNLQDLKPIGGRCYQDSDCVAHGWDGAGVGNFCNRGICSIPLSIGQTCSDDRNCDNFLTKKVVCDQSHCAKKMIDYKGNVAIPSQCRGKASMGPGTCTTFY